MTTPQTARTRTAFLALSALVPFLLYVATASSFDYWLDSSEFVAASMNLGIAHPPGQPLTALVGRIFSMLPIGPVVWRIALANGFFASLAGLAIFLSAERTLLRVLTSTRAVLPLALGASFAATLAHGFWLQAIRPEVYAVQAALACVAVERMIALETSLPTNNLGALYGAALSVGLALANHHFLAFLLFPAFAPTLARVALQHGWKPLVIAGAFLAAGLSTYLYLPIRAALHAEPNLGNPTTIARIFWVVSAVVYQKSSGLTPEPMSERFADVAVQLVDSLGPVFLLMAVVGLYALARTQKTRRVAWIWGALFVITSAARGWLGFVRSNPDALGYLMMAFAAGAVLASAMVAETIALIGERAPRFEKMSAVIFGACFLLLGLSQADRAFAHTNLSHFSATNAFDDLRHRELPYGAVVLAYSPSTVFRHWGGEAAERLRPDITLIPMPFLEYPGTIDSLLAHDPTLAPLLRSYLLDGELGEEALQTLAATRPVFLELDARVNPALYRTLVPAGGLYEVLADGAATADERSGRATLEAADVALYARLGTQKDNHETSEVLLWKHYHDALYFAAMGDREGARHSIERGLSLDPISKELLALKEAVGDENAKGKIDIRPFFLGPNASVVPPTH